MTHVGKNETHPEKANQEVNKKFLFIHNESLDPTTPKDHILLL
jgi:hypothetical protein